MAEQTKIRADLSGLESLLKDIGGAYYARVGILGSDAGEIHDTDSGLTNSEVGLINEFGSETRGIPARSFLRMPLETQQDTLIQTLDTGAVKDAIEQGDTKQVYKILGFAAEQIVKDAFNTGGFGNWKGNADSTIARKGEDRPLIETGTLQRSITSDVVKKGEI